MVVKRAFRHVSRILKLRVLWMAANVLQILQLEFWVFEKFQKSVGWPCLHIFLGSAHIMQDPAGPQQCELLKNRSFARQAPKYQQFVAAREQQCCSLEALDICVHDVVPEMEQAKPID